MCVVGPTAIAYSAPPATGEAVNCVAIVINMVDRNWENFLICFLSSGKSKMGHRVKYRRR